MASRIVRMFPERGDGGGRGVRRRLGATLYTPRGVAGSAGRCRNHVHCHGVYLSDFCVAGLGDSANDDDPSVIRFWLETPVWLPRGFAGRVDRDRPRLDSARPGTTIF